MANKTSWWIFDPKCYLFNIYIRTQPGALLMHNLTVNVSLCADMIRRVFRSNFPSFDSKGHWDKETLRHSDYLHPFMASERNTAIGLKNCIRLVVSCRTVKHVNQLSSASQVSQQSCTKESTWPVQPLLFGPTEEHLLTTWKSDMLSP